MSENNGIDFINNGFACGGTSDLHLPNIPCIIVLWRLWEAVSTTPHCAPVLEQQRKSLVWVGALKRDRHRCRLLRKYQQRFALVCRLVPAIITNNHFGSFI